MIQIENTTFSYSGEEEKESLRGLNLHIHQGECVLLCGASGCGKTTVTKLINGLIPHFNDGKLSGSTVVDGLTVAETPLYRLSQKVGSVFQNPKSQFFNIDTDSELAFGLENSGVDPEIIRERIRQTVRDLCVEKLLHRDIFSMSGGEKQSLAFASVYAMNPDIYVLDEPSANLDGEATEILRKQIRCIKEQGKTIVIAEHRLWYLADLADRILWIEEGKVRREYTREEFLSISDEKRCELGLRTVHRQPRKAFPPLPERGELEVRDLSIRIGKETIFEHLNFSARAGKVLGIWGHNGAGKTTLIRCLAGLQSASEGQILYQGKALRKKQRQKLSFMIMQDVNHQLFGDSVWNECRLGSGDSVGDSFISAALERFDLLEWKDKHPMALSGGQKQRLAIVTGIAAGKKILMFDEPTSGLDYAHMCTVSNTLRELAEEGHIVMVITHDVELLNRACDEILEL